MSHSSINYLKASAAALLLVVALAGCSNKSSQQIEAPSASAVTNAAPTFDSLNGTVIATGLNNPRKLAIGPRGSLFVTEAGLGAGDESSGAQEGLGTTGSVTVVDRPASAHPAQHRALTGLTSGTEDVDGELDTIGPDGIAFGGPGANAPMYLIFGEHGPSGLGQLVRYAGDANATTVADVGAADYTWTGDHSDLWEEFPDANPYGVLAVRGHLYVVDAGANTLDEVMPNGDVHVLAYFPNYADIGGIRDAVPTCIAQGPDGALYIGTLALAERFNIGQGQALVYRVDPAQTNPDDMDTILHVATVWASGFDTISACTFGPNGDFYATEMFGGNSFGGDVVHVPFAHPDHKDRFGEGQVTLPSGIAVGTGGIYVSSGGNSTDAGAGSVVRFSAG